MAFPEPAKLCQNAGNAPLGFSLDGMVMEPKYDGFRLLCNVDQAYKCHPYTRTGKSQHGKIPFIEDALANGLPINSWLDGELVAFDSKGMPEWGRVQSCMGSNAGDPTGSLVYVVFDILAYDGLDIRPLPHAERRAALQTVVGQINSPHVLLAPQFPANMSTHEDWVAVGMEGSIIKDPTKPYASGRRGYGWTKLKASDEIDVVIMGLESGSDLGAFVFGQYKDGALTQRGKCKVYSHCAHLSHGEVISVAHNGIMPSGSVRHAMYKRHRIDKRAEDCLWT
jgi:ATP-dependent DNA ligase